MNDGIVQTRIITNDDDLEVFGNERRRRGELNRVSLDVCIVMPPGWLFGREREREGEARPGKAANAFWASKDNQTSVVNS